ncbi:bifunctional 3,4-dihydroxy-2-butanone-4-phosphate synthase/GTP cyclohydrolase II [Pseudogracilibacillus auburnensis]|uniref:bifunctional 3,4-dihydroxy-2-butanone-4-phosphate synthase/GTP cyclohydrolase II n=1 Tax=Pseudogracilibacillus auburnensis TaxID=1494959 RepID=UPI001A96F80C|nr:bifunctional 3,4-dihydroxy-2-butanone-4-phosphate synthase/GTP cyclohydrolase II [Pseudogracilibacillus auburnensis]MBO1001409.1 bifunctional 3,4-dihydroxy-2-butanone-4-phosphate synthase/GTP cyclohydrolase II [Pseudogracilibacillus auburnensis]
MFHTIEEAIADLQQGKIIIVVDDEDRENEGDFVALSEKITPETINFMITHGKGLVCTSITPQLAEKLELPLMTARNTDPYSTAFTVSIDHKDTTTGISAFERALTIKALTKKSVTKSEFKQPGHVFPLIAKAGGVLERPGHTEASTDLALLSGAFPSGVICEIVKEDGSMARILDLQKIAQTFKMKMITIEDLVAYRKKHETRVVREAETTLATKFGEFRIIGYSNNLDDKEHLALVKGEVDHNEAVLTRIHSECLTGDIFHSLRCDCGPQLESALEMINDHGSGVLVYMRQEGRGIGLFNKLRAYELQDTGLDTVEANHALGFSDDLREYGISAAILKDLQVREVELVTNNPRKIAALESNEVKVVKRVPIEIAAHDENYRYLATKKQKLGHLLT